MPFVPDEAAPSPPPPPPSAFDILAQMQRDYDAYRPEPTVAWMRPLQRGDQEFTIVPPSPGPPPPPPPPMPQMVLDQVGWRDPESGIDFGPQWPPGLGEGEARRFTDLFTPEDRRRAEALMAERDSLKAGGEARRDKALWDALRRRRTLDKIHPAREI